MRFPHGETVIRHPHVGWETGRDGQPTGRPLFGDDEPVRGVAFSDTLAEDLVLRADSAVAAEADLWLDYWQPCTDHDEWTARGERWLQDGGIKRWRHPYTGREHGATVHIYRRKG